MLIPIFQKHNEELAALAPHDFAPGTVERYKTSLSHTLEFLRHKYYVSDIDIKKIDHEFITDFDFFLRTVHKCANNNTIKYVSNFKKIVRICIANGWLAKAPFVSYKPKLKHVERAFLSEEESQALIEKEFASPRIQQVKNTFVFSCFTRLAYADVQKLSRNDGSIGIDGENGCSSPVQRQMFLLPFLCCLLPWIL